MSESGGSKPDITGTTWAEGPGEFLTIDPLGAKKQVGWDGTTFEIPAAEHHNWMFREWARGIRWMAAAHVREFEDLNEAIAATPEPQMVRIRQQVPNRALGAQAWAMTPAGFTLITDAASDGERIYYLNTAGAVAAINPDNGVEIWNPGVVSSSGGAVAADGRDVYLCGDAVLPGLLRLNRDNGAIIDRTGTPQYATDIAANGQFAVMADGALLPNNLYYYNISVVPSVETGSTSHGNPVYACAVDHTNVYWGGVQGGGIDLRANDLATRSAVWTASFPSGAAAPVLCIETDGSYVYVGTTRMSLTAGGFANFFVYDCSAGQLIEAADIQIGANADSITNIALDGKYIHCTLDGTTAGVLSLGGIPGGALYLEANLSAVAAVCYDADGIGLACSDGTAQAERYYYQDLSREFQRALGIDPNRRPFHKLALPVR
jgi:outer membrane protein assembly factor BamB